MIARVLPEPVVGRSYELQPAGHYWWLDFMIDGKRQHGKTFAVACNESGFDAGYAEAVAAGEAWCAL